LLLKKKIIVQKYGGSSVATPEKIKHVAKRVSAKVQEGYRVVVVLSAMGDTTDDLIDLAAKITENPSDREMDMLLSTGEQISIALFSMAINDLGLKGISLTGGQVGILADSIHRKAKIKSIKTGRLKKELTKHDVVVVAGFQGVDTKDNIVTLGRGGSDLSAVALATVLKAEMCEIFTDVEGVYSADPRVVPEAKKIPEISFDEMLEMAASGAQVMQARSIEFGKIYNTIIHVRSTFSENEGTLIREETKSMEKVLVRGVASDTKQAKITLRNLPDKPGIAAKIFSTIAAANINVDMIIQNVSNGMITDLSFTAPVDDLAKLMKITDKIVKEAGASEVSTDTEIAKISIVGVGMRSHSGIAAKMFSTLAKADINIQMISTSEIKISVVVAKGDATKAVKALHKAFGLEKA
jgi:aspartate kinase